jgi:hypothetical protein
MKGTFRELATATKPRSALGTALRRGSGMLLFFIGTDLLVGVEPTM